MIARVEGSTESRLSWGTAGLSAVLVLGVLVVIQPALGWSPWGLVALLLLLLLFVLARRVGKQSPALLAVAAGVALGGLAYVVLWITAASTGFPSNWFGSSDAPITAVYVEPGSKRLEVSVGTCNQQPQVTAIETTEKVRLRSNEKVPRGSVDDCLDSDVVELDRPLGSRVVIDDATGEQIQVLPAG